MLKSKTPILTIFSILTVCLAIISPVTASADISLRDWLDTPFNECLNAKVENLFQADDNVKITFLQYTVQNRPQPLTTVDARFLIRNISLNKARAVQVELAAFQDYNWHPFPVDNFYLGYRTEQMNPMALIRSLSTVDSFADVMIDLTSCINLDTH